ncbi:hypothetical protein N7449_005047 [Penicillium cf. viridicatum]|uniref:Uncharacterized protein n=1 Tax=Penicillium cf. viridicatum TaxID=2972119 RepID=A0A9W9SYN0_9EURO|nr:hypothetical protein N7449_005047 [Penicillium cf. viridicatum]
MAIFGFILPSAGFPPNFSSHGSMKWLAHSAISLTDVYLSRISQVEIFYWIPIYPLKFCDFSEASLLPLESNMETVDDNGFTIQIDVGLLGAVMYEITPPLTAGRIGQRGTIHQAHTISGLVGSLKIAGTANFEMPSVSCKH